MAKSALPVSALRGRMIDVNGRGISVSQAIASVKLQQTGVQVQRQVEDPPIDVLRQKLRHEAAVKQLSVIIDHVDDDILLIIPMRHTPTSGDIRAAMNAPTGI